MASVSASANLSPCPPPWSRRGTLRGCAVTALAHGRHRHDLIHRGKQPPLLASFQCFPSVWLPVWGGAHSHVRKFFAVFLHKKCWFSLISEGTKRLGSLWSSQSSSTEIQCSVLQDATHTLLCCVFSRHPRFASFLTSLTVSLSYLNVKKHFSKYRCYLCPSWLWSVILGTSQLHAF